MRRFKVMVVLTMVGCMVGFKLYGGISPSASAISAGGAITADTINSRALQYNVGGLGLLKYYEIELSHQSRIFNTSFEQLNFVTPFSYGGVGISIQFFHSFFNSENFNFSLGQKGESLNDYDLTGTVGFGMPIMKNLGIGVGVNYLRNSFLGEAQNSFSFNIGFLYKMRLLSKYLHIGILSNKLASKEDFSLGVAINKIASDEGMEIRTGMAILPFYFLKLYIDSGYVMEKYYDNQFDLRTGLEFAYKIKFTKFLLRAGYSVNTGEFNIGTGLQVNFGEKFYRLDYAQNLIKEAEFQNDFGTKVGAFSLVIGESELLLKLIKGKGFILPSDYFRIQDKIIMKKRIFEKKDEAAEQKFDVKILDIKTTDKYIKAKKYNIKLGVMLTEQIKKVNKLQLNDKKPEIYIKTEILRDGELMRGVVKIMRGSEKLGENIFEKTIKFDREAIKNYDTVDIFIKKVGNDIKIISKKQGEQEDKDLKKVKEIANEIADWINDNIEKMLTGKYNIVSDSSGVDIYIDGEYKGTIGKNKRYEISLLRGKHKLIFIKKNVPAKEMEIVSKPREEKDIKVRMVTGKFYVGMNISSFPSGIKVWVDGKKYGATPVEIKRIFNGEHKIKYVNSKGEEWEEKIYADREGIFRLYAVEKYEDKFNKLNKKFWNTIQGEKGIKLKVRDGIMQIIGNSRDGLWAPTGVISREFKTGDISLETDFGITGNKFFAVIGLIDEQGEGVALGIDDKYFQYYETGKDAETYVPAINFRDKSKLHNVEIKYNDGSVSIYVDDMAVVENKVKKLSDNIRVMILTDNEEAGSGSKFKVLNFVLKNDF